MLSVLSWNWTRIAVSISCDDNHYTTGTSKRNDRGRWKKIEDKVDKEKERKKQSKKKKMTRRKQKRWDKKLRIHPLAVKRKSNFSIHPLPFPNFVKISVILNLSLVRLLGFWDFLCWFANHFAVYSIFTFAVYLDLPFSWFSF